MCGKCVIWRNVKLDRWHGLASSFNKSKCICLERREKEEEITDVNGVETQFDWRF